MLHVVTAIVPLAMVVALGYLLTRGGLFRREEMSVLSRLVVKVALPMLIFHNLAGRPAADILQPVFLLAYAGVGVVMFVLGHLYARALGRTRARAATISMGMAGVNNGFMGFPLYLILLPEWAGAAVGMGMLVDNALIIPLTLFLLEQSHGGGSLGERLRSTVRHVVLHPMVIALVLALLCTAVGWTVPEPIDNAVALLAQVSSGVALFVVGGLLHGLRIRGTRLDIGVGVLGKLLVAPTLALGVVLAAPALGLPALPPPLAAAAVLTCALPTYTVLPSVAEPHGEGDVATASLMVQTVLSFATLSVWLVVVSGLGWL